MLDIKPITSSAIPAQLELSRVSQLPQQSLMNSSAVTTSSCQCQHPFIDNLLNGISNLVLQAVGNLFNQIGLGGLGSATSATAATPTESQPIVRKPGWLEQGVDFVSGLFSGNLGGLLNIFKGEGSIFSKAKDVIAKFF